LNPQNSFAESSRSHAVIEAEVSIVATPHHEQLPAVVDGQLTGSAERDLVLSHDADQMLRALERAFGQAFTVIDSATGGAIRSAATALPIDLYSRLASCAQISDLGRPEVLDEVSPLLVLAVPLPSVAVECRLVAIGTFLTDRIDAAEQITAAANEFGLDIGLAWQWAQAQTPWPAKAIHEVALAIADKIAVQQNAAQVKQQLADISSHLLMTFEEITLLHRLTEHLSISKSVTDLCSLSVNWLADVIPAKSVAIWFESISDSQSLGQGTTSQAILISHGDCPLNQEEAARFIERLGPKVATEPLVLNRAATSCPNWFYPDVREIISVPIREGNRLFGWLLALNHTGDGDITNSEAEFGTVEACLMASVATILGIHCGNIALYHEQSEFFSSVVRALTSAIDAKDPYTCGHSDRVARLSVCLARQLGCDSNDLNTIYLSGLLHDIGKIGIDDNVLRKPGALTPEEFDHIKTHPELGCRILDGVKQLDKVLPVVRHHHESWNGQGYPAGLVGEETPFLARIVAVADSIDAMSSDRPYRKGIPDEKLDAILRDGAGKQWDSRIIEAAFQVREELRRIGADERNPLSLDVTDWQLETACVASDETVVMGEADMSAPVEHQHKYVVAQT
jgi:putative nucleotidyltransferase with HDIG domain